jgi:hypothetical protein
MSRAPLRHRMGTILTGFGQSKIGKLGMLEAQDDRKVRLHEGGTRSRGWGRGLVGERAGRVSCRIHTGDL